MLIPEQHRERARVVGGRSARAVSGYVFGNLLISVIAGVAHLARARRSSASPTPACSPCGSPSPTSSRWSAPRSAPSRRSAFAFLHSTPAGIVAADLLHRLPAVREPRAAGRRSCRARSTSTRWPCSSACSSASSCSASSARCSPSPPPASSRSSSATSAGTSEPRAGCKDEPTRRAPDEVPVRDDGTTATRPTTRA